MLKFFSLVSLLILFFWGNVQAIVQQSASSALSYRNVVSGSRNAKSHKKNKNISTKIRKVTKAPLETQQVDLRNATTKTVDLLLQEKVEIILNEDVGYSWELSYDNGTVSMISNTINDGFRVIKFIQNGKQNSTIFFDYIDPEGSTVRNKALYIKVK